MAFSSDNSSGPMNDINVTPLVDVMLVLLIIFIITAPLMAHKVKIELPEANLVQNGEEENDRIMPITISVTEDGSLFWNDEPITREVMESRLSSVAQQTPQPPLNLRADRTTRTGVIQDVIKVAQGQGMLDIGFVATKEKGQ